MPLFKIPLSRPDITDEDIAAVTAVLRTSQLSLGPKLREFEDAVSRYAGTEHAVALSSGTAGLQLGLEALGIGEGDEVIVPSFAFIAAANAIALRRATPVFADVDAVTLNLDPAKLEPLITGRTRALVVVHTFGYPAEMNSLIAIASRYGLRLIEDACEAIGAEWRGRRVGSLGDLGVFSFYPNKPITTGEGGVLVTGDRTVASTVRALRNQGRRDNDGWLEHSMVGYNFRLPEMSCALGISQLRRLDHVLEQRQALAERYAQALRSVPGVAAPPISIDNGRICWFAFVVRMPESFSAGDRDSVIREMETRGVQCRAYFPPLHQQPLYAPYASGREDLRVTESISARTIALPFFNDLSNEEVRFVCESLGAAMTVAQERKGDCR